MNITTLCISKFTLLQFFFNSLINQYFLVTLSNNGVYSPVSSNIGNNSPLYIKQKIRSGCCTGQETYHERCFCAAKIPFCKESCDEDEKCKGYVGDRHGHCQIATTSQCPDNVYCEKYSIGESNELSTNYQCGPSDLEGCFVKKIGQ